MGRVATARAVLQRRAETYRNPTMNQAVNRSWQANKTNGLIKYGYAPTVSPTAVANRSAAADPPKAARLIAGLSAKVIPAARRSLTTRNTGSLQDDGLANLNCANVFDPQRKVTITTKTAAVMARLRGS